MEKKKTIFSKLTEKFGKKKVIAIAILIVVAIIVLIIAINSKSSSTDTTDKGTIEKAQKRTIVNSISGTGTVESVNNDEVTSDVTNVEVLSVNVEVGQEVSEGDVICYLDTSDLEEQRDSVEDQISESKKEKKKQDKEYDSQSKESKKSQASQLKSAKEKYKNAKSEYETAKADLDSYQKKYDDLIASGVSETSTQAVNLANTIESKKSNVQAKKTTMESYKEQVDSLKNNDDYDNSESKKEYDESMDDSIDSLQDQIDDLDESIDKCTVKATSSGTITEINVDEGDTYSGGTIALVEGLDQLQIVAEVDEYDIADVEKGQRVLIKTDSTRDEELEGQVTFVAPRASNSSSSSTMSSVSTLLGGTDVSSLTGSSSDSASYEVRISLDDVNSRLRLGMNAKISIITEEKDDILSVPYDAIQEDEDGNQYVYVVTSDEKAEEITKKKVAVTTGIEGTYYTEVKSSQIKEGTRIYIPEATGSDSVDDLINMMGSSSGT